MAPNECLGEITVFKINDSSACFMVHGSARRVGIDNVQAAS